MVRRTRRDPRHDILFEPLRIGPKVLRNRFYQVPHCSGLGDVKPFSQAEHRGVKAEGGWAAVSTEYAPVSLESDESPWISARLWDAEDAANLGLMAERAHEFGSLAAIELHHSGAHCYGGEARAWTLAPSQLASDLNAHIVPKAMEQADITRVKAEWVRAARAARDVGFDIIYVYGGHSYLPMQFLSPFYNHREDSYGGSFVNRARFWLELLEDVRNAVGDDCALACRVAVAALGPAGVELDEGLQLVQAADDLVDLWDLTIGSINDWSKDSGASRFFKEGYQLEWTGQVRQATTRPIVGVGRLTSPDLMAEIVRTGAFDLIGAARPSIADPFLPNKIEEGRYDEIRECIGCNVCVMKSEQLHHIGCTQNATAGEEYRRGWHPERFSRAANADLDVLVLGGGPAGMECAITLAKRQMRRVHLVEAAAELGGCMSWIPRLPGLGEWARVVNWRVVQLDRLANVEVIRSVRLTASQVREYGAELVVLATGSRWSSDGLSAATHAPIPGALDHRERVLVPEDVMVSGRRPAGERVLVYDAEGYFVAAGVAELLAIEGYDVELVTCLEQVAPLCDETLEGPMLRQRLHDCGVKLRRGVTLSSIGPEGALGEDEFGEPLSFAVDGVVLVTQRRSDDALYRELEADWGALRDEGVVGLYRVGDCVAPRIPADAIFDGHRLGREIDSADPSVPLPYLRERISLLPGSPALTPAARG
ncbi:MAG TPA: FAD-dependent oxidoreductase [Acidimicrobiales bacterium]|nr:FAD-dependent oxidoreductase [Acidimicrobiales bacterium]